MWLLQKNIWKEEKYDHISDLLTRYGIEHTIINLIPFSETLELPCAADEIEMVFGSIRFVELAKQQGVKIHFNSNFNFQVWSEVFQEQCLNYDSYISSVGHLQLPFNHDRFIRPILDDKSFTGTVLRAGDTFDQIQFTTSKPREDIVIQVASIKDIQAEYRFFVVNGVVVTGSIYRLGRRVFYNRVDSGSDLWQFAQRRIEQWQPADMFVIDIADTREGLKIVEFGSIHNCGFYDCDLSKLIQSIHGRS